MGAWPYSGHQEHTDMLGSSDRDMSVSTSVACARPVPQFPQQSSGAEGCALWHARPVSLPVWQEHCP